MEVTSRRAASKRRKQERFGTMGCFGNHSVLRSRSLVSLEGNGTIPHGAKSGVAQDI
jgi:hypothetical protein